MKIPNKLTIPTMLSGLLLHGFSDGWTGILFAAAGLGTGFGLLFILYWVGAVGAGDVKLFGGIGAWTGAAFVLHAAFYSILYAGLVGVIVLLWRRETRGRLRGLLLQIGGFLLLRSKLVLAAGRDSYLRFPFMIAVIPGVISTYFYLIHA